METRSLPTFDGACWILVAEKITALQLSVVDVSRKHTLSQSFDIISRHDLQYMRYAYAMWHSFCPSAWKNKRSTGSCGAYVNQLIFFLRFFNSAAALFRGSGALWGSTPKIERRGKRARGWGRLQSGSQGWQVHPRWVLLWTTQLTLHDRWNVMLWTSNFCLRWKRLPGSFANLVALQSVIF